MAASASAAQSHFAPKPSSSVALAPSTMPNARASAGLMAGVPPGRRSADGIHASGPSAPPEDEGGDQDAGHGEPDAEDPEGRRALLGGAGEDVEVLSEKSRQE